MLKIAVCEDDRNFIDLIAGELNLFFSKKNWKLRFFHMNQQENLQSH